MSYDKRALKKVRFQAGQSPRASWLCPRSFLGYQSDVQFTNSKAMNLGEMDSYRGLRCGDEHVVFEPAFRWPDGAAVMGTMMADVPDDRLVLEGRSFVRGVLRFPIKGANGLFAVAIWLELDGPDRGRIANQLDLLAPLLGAHARVAHGPSGVRASFELSDHPLARAQRDGLDPEVIARWRSDEAHRTGGEPIGAPFDVRLTSSQPRAVCPPSGARPRDSATTLRG